MLDMRTPKQDSYAAFYRYDGDQIVCVLTDYQQDIDQTVTIGDEIRLLTGWPTPAMRPIIGEDGEPTGEWMGCDEIGIDRPLTDGLFVAVIGAQEIGYGRTEEECIEDATDSVKTGRLVDPSTGRYVPFDVLKIHVDGNHKSYEDIIRVRVHEDTKEG